MKIKDKKKELENEILDKYKSISFCPKCNKVLSNFHKKSNCFKSFIKLSVLRKLKQWKKEK